jgi:predicted HTH domain antitoxin
MSTVTVSMRLPRSEVARLDAAARAVGSERSAFLKRALQRGAADLMFEQACQAYRDDEATLTRAAKIAGLTLRDMMHRMQRADLELNYGVDELARDLQE